MRACVLVIYCLVFVGVERVFPLSYIVFVAFGPEMNFFRPFFVVLCLSWRV